MVEYKWVVLSNTSLSMLMGSIDANILLIALPAILRGIGLDITGAGNFVYLIWILFGYGLVTATLLVSFGRLSDIFGRVRLYNFGFLIFAIGSTALFFVQGSGDTAAIKLGSMALLYVPNAGSTAALEIIFFRIIQGIGGAFLMANGAAIITDAFPVNERGKALGINMVVFLAGSLIGLILGGFLATADLYIPLIFTTLFIPGWRVVFLVSVPIGIFGAFWSYWKLKEIGVINRNQKLDLTGNFLFAGGLTIFVLALTYGLVPYGGQSMGWSSPWVIGGILLGILMLVAFPFWEARAEQPMFKLGLFKIRIFTMGNIAGVLASITRGGVMIMLIILLQGIWLPLFNVPIDQTPLYAGFLMIPMALGFVIMGPISGMLSDRYGSKFLATLGMIITALSFIGLLLIPANPNASCPSCGFSSALTNPNIWLFLILLLIAGLGGGLFASPNIASIMNSVPPEHRGVANGMRATLQNTGSTLSITFFFTIIIYGLANSLPGALYKALTGVGVSATQALGISNGISPTEALFAAFLGENPLGPLSVNFPSLTIQWFSQTISGSFMQALDIAFILCAILAIIAALASYSRGKVYYHGMDNRPDFDTPTDKTISTTDPVLESGFD